MAGESFVGLVAGVILTHRPGADFIHLDAGQLVQFARRDAGHGGGFHLGQDPMRNLPGPPHHFDVVPVLDDDQIGTGR
ncbi:MAG TPA: hypothetical protein VL992_18855 [Tepidisphaeraceae bacterium]|nr:hypothetical protein [Tepidisphaeraceae bacterium]